MCAVTASSRRDISCPFRLLVPPGAEVAVAPQRRLAPCSGGTVEVEEFGHERQVPLSVSRPSTTENWPVTPIASRTASGSCATSWPATRTSPPSAPISVDSMCTPVVFAGAVGPEQREDRSFGDSQVDAARDELAAVRVAQSSGCDHGPVAGHGLSPQVHHGRRDGPPCAMCARACAGGSRYCHLGRRTGRTGPRWSPQPGPRPHRGR